MRVLIACEFSGTVRDAFAAIGHDAWSCDLLPSEKPGKHVTGDVLKILDDGWDLAVMHPPCTYILNSGCKWLYQGGKRFLEDGAENELDGKRWNAMQDGARFFKSCLEAPIERICVENPIMVGYALEIVGRDYDQIIQPHQFGHPESKQTCLWLKNLPPLQGTKDVSHIMQSLPRKQRERVHYASPKKDRWKERSRTLPGIAEAMAQQWGKL